MSGLDDLEKKIGLNIYFTYLPIPRWNAHYTKTQFINKECISHSFPLDVAYGNKSIATHFSDKK